MSIGSTINRNLQPCQLEKYGVRMMVPDIKLSLQKIFLLTHSSKFHFIWTLATVAKFHLLNFSFSLSFFLSLYLFIFTHTDAPTNVAHKHTQKLTKSNLQKHSNGPTEVKHSVTNEWTNECSIVHPTTHSSKLGQPRTLFNLISVFSNNSKVLLQINVKNDASRMPCWDWN